MSCPLAWCVYYLYHLGLVSCIVVVISFSPLLSCLDIPGVLTSFALSDKMVVTSQEWLSFTRIGRHLDSVYFPSLWQSLIEWLDVCSSSDRKMFCTESMSFLIRVCLGVPLSHSLTPNTTRLSFLSCQLCVNVVRGVVGERLDTDWPEETTLVYEAPLCVPDELVFSGLLLSLFRLSSLAFRASTVCLSCCISSFWAVWQQ